MGGYVSVVTKSGTNATHGTAYGFFRDDSLNAANALSGTTLPMGQQQYGGSLGGPIARNRTFYFTNFEQRLLDQTGLVTILPQNVADHQRAAEGCRLSGRTGRDRRVSQPGAQRQLPREGRSPDQRSRSAVDPVQPLRRDVGQLPRGRGAERAVGVSGARQHRSGGGIREHVDAVVADRERDARAVHLQRPAGVADRSGRARGQHCRRGVVRDPVRQPDGASEQDVPGGGQRLASTGGPRAARRSRLRVQRRHDHVPAVVARRVHVCVDGHVPHGQLQRVCPDVRRSRGLADQSEHRDVRAGRVAGQLAADTQSGPAVRPAVHRDGEHRQRPTCRRVPGSPGRRRRRATPSSAAARGCSSTACPCGPSPTPSSRQETRRT